MFRRRHQRSYWQHGREFLWPRAGWRRAVKYFGYRVLRMPGTPYNIAAGIASGVAMSMTPFIGLHFLLSAGLAWVVGGNLIASAIGTFVGNPWTFPLIWLWCYSLGHFVMGTTPAEEGLPDHLTLSFVFDHPWRVLVPMMIGSVPSALIAWPLAFFPVRAIVRKFQEQRARRRLKKGTGGAAPRREGAR